MRRPSARARRLSSVSSWWAPSGGPRKFGREQRQCSARSWPRTEWRLERTGRRSGSGSSRCSSPGVCPVRYRCNLLKMVCIACTGFANNIWIWFMTRFSTRNYSTMSYSTQKRTLFHSSKLHYFVANITPAEPQNISNILTYCSSKHVYWIIYLSTIYDTP